MTRVQQRLVAVVAAFVLAIGCALAIGTPQHAYASKYDHNLTAGSTFGSATNLNYGANKVNLTTSNKTQFKTDTYKNFYKFTTSGRDSRYRIWLTSYEGYWIYATLYDSRGSRIAALRTNSKLGTSWAFKNLKRNSVYYVEVWRFVQDDTYVDFTYSTPAAFGNAQIIYPTYKIRVAELITKPVVTGLSVKSNSAYSMRLTWNEPSYSTAGIQIEFYWGWQTKSKKNTFYRTATGRSKVITKLKYHGTSHPYKVRIRAYRIVNNKKYYGAWTAYKTVYIK